MCPKTKEQNEIIREEKKSIILDAALHLFAEEGYHSASVSKIANKASISKGLLYNYFNSKEDVLKTLIFEMTDKMMEKFPSPTEKPTKEHIELYIDKSCDIILEDITYAKLFFVTYMQPEVMAIVNDKMMQKASPFMNFITTYFASKKAQNPEAMMFYFSAVLDGIQMHMILNPNFPVEEVKKILKQQFIK